MAANPFRPLADAWDRLAGSDADPSGLAAWIAGFRARRAFHAASLGADVQLFGRPVLHLDPGASVQIGSGVRISARAARTRIEVGPGATLQVGAGAVLDDVALLQAYGRVAIGDNARVGYGVAILDDEGVPGRPPMPVLIGAEAKIGARSTVLRGVRIGRGATVAAGSLVTEDVPAGATVAGVPAVVVEEAPAPKEKPEAVAGAEAAPEKPAKARAVTAQAVTAEEPTPAKPLRPAVLAPVVGAQGDGAAQPAPDADAVVLRPSALKEGAKRPTASAEPVAAPVETVAETTPEEDAAPVAAPADDDAPPVWPPHAKLRA